MKYEQKCSECGNKTTAYTYKLSKPLIHAFNVFVDAYLNNKEVPLSTNDL